LIFPASLNVDAEGWFLTTSKAGGTANTPVVVSTEVLVEVDAARWLAASEVAAGSSAPAVALSIDVNTDVWSVATTKLGIDTGIPLEVFIFILSPFLVDVDAE